MADFYCDEDVPDPLAERLIALGNRAIITREAGRKGSDDYQQLWYAASRGWVLLTRNGRDFTRLHRAWHLWGVPRPHPGIVIVPQLPTSALSIVAEEIHDLASDPVTFMARMIVSGRAAANTIGRVLTDGLIVRDTGGQWTFHAAER